MSELAEPVYVWFGLLANFERIIHYAAAVAAWGDLRGDDTTTTEKELFLSLSAETMQKQLILELTRIFDKDMSCGRENCSLMMLKTRCISDSKYFPDGKTDKYVLKIDQLCDTYKTLIPRNVRNKQIAHLDLQTLYLGEPSCVCFSDIYNLVEETQSVLESICERFLGISAKLPNVAELKKEYVISLHRLLGEVTPHDQLG